jgi:hypothetical protein
VRHYADTYKVVIREPDGTPFAAIGNLPSSQAAQAVIESQAMFCRDVHGFAADFRVFLVGQSGTCDVTTDLIDDPEFTAQQDEAIDARHAAYHES